MESDFLNKILKAINAGESSDWEMKSARGGFPGSFWETYSAMANENGGIIFLGANERESSIDLHGLTAEQIHHYQKILWDGLHNKSTISLNLLTQEHIQVVEIDQKKFLAVTVPRASRTQRPVYIGPLPFGNTYRRQHEGDYVCSDAEVRRMYRDADPVPADARVLKGFTLDDLDPVSITQYRQLFSVRKHDHPWLTLNNSELLKKLGGWRKDKDSGLEGITLAGLLMFGRYESIIDVSAAPNYFVDYREKLNPTQRWSHRLFPDGTWEANLFQFFHRILPQLTADLPVPFMLEGLQRIDDTPAHKAVREAVVNALIHSDYSAPGGVVIERYRNKFTLENPGTLLVSPEQLRRGGVSECRNKDLQQMFLMIGGGEKAGSGFDTIQTGWASQHWRAPGLLLYNHPDRVRLVLSMTSLIPENVLTELQQRFGTQFAKLEGLEVQALVTAQLEGEVSNIRLQELAADHPVEITQILQGLCSKKMLVSDNRRRWARYKLPQKVATNTSLGGYDKRNSPHLNGNSPHLNGNLSYLSELDQELVAILSSVTHKKKLSKLAKRDIILRLCKGRYLSLEQLASLLKRYPKGLRDRNLTPMVAEGLLQLRYPDTPNRPDQAYTAC